MAYNEDVANRVRELLADREGLTEKKMFGGLAFLLHGHMCCGVLEDDLVVRVGPEQYHDALAEPYTRPMDFTGRPLKGMVYVAPKGYLSKQALERWIRRALEFARSLPPK